MILKFHTFLSLLLVLTVQGCATFQSHEATPYHQRPDPPQVREKPGLQGPTEHPFSLPQDSIVKDISNQADQQMRNGELDEAAQTLERGLRIAPKDAYLWSQLAVVRLKQHRYGQAQSLAAKSNSLAKDNAELIHKNLSIIETAQK